MKTDFIFALIISILIIFIGIAFRYGYSEGYSDGILSERIHSIVRNYE
jgi:hypothetical protein